VPELVLHALAPSHPCMTAEAALRLKGLAYERIDFTPGEHTEKMAELYRPSSTTSTLLTVGDQRPLLEGRPGEEIARRWFPDYPGDVPAGTYPAGWVPSHDLHTPGGEVSSIA
jgi:hypothetical protein